MAVHLINYKNSNNFWDSCFILPLFIGFSHKRLACWSWEISLLETTAQHFEHMIYVFSGHYCVISLFWIPPSQLCLYLNQTSCDPPGPQVSRSLSQPITADSQRFQLTSYHWWQSITDLLHLSNLPIVQRYSRASSINKHGYVIICFNERSWCMMWMLEFIKKYLELNVKMMYKVNESAGNQFTPWIREALKHRFSVCMYTVKCSA